MNRNGLLEGERVFQTQEEYYQPITQGDTGCNTNVNKALGVFIDSVNHSHIKTSIR